MEVSSPEKVNILNKTPLGVFSFGAKCLLQFLSQSDENYSVSEKSKARCIPNRFGSNSRKYSLP